MSGLIKNTASLLLCAVMALTASFGALALESTPDTAPAENEIIVSSAEIEKTSFASAVQKALNQAGDESSDDKNIIVKVEPGEYETEKGLRIFGNTTLSLYGVTIKRAQNVFINMVRTGNEDSVTKGVTGYYHKNILIEGGVFDASLTVSTMIKVAHAENFKMKDVTLLNAKNSHMMEVAGVDGFTLENCVFKNQVIDLVDDTAVCYEAVQLDVLKAGHIVNCRSEDLAIKNVNIEGCDFEDLPRAVGAHTAILNNPLRNITIKNNTFLNMGSAAVQSLGWVNCKITGNYIEKTPRAIAVYSVFSNGAGTYLPEVLANEGEVESSTNSEYTKPEDSKTVISDNIIKDCSSVEDVYGSYKMSAISAMGYDIPYVYERGNDDSAGLPAGNYFLKGVTVKNNYIEVRGTGCRLESVTNTEVSSNSINCKQSEFYPDSNYYGIVVRAYSRLSAVSNNYIDNAKTNGIHIGERCSVDYINYNKIDKPSKHGIAVYRSTVKQIAENRVSSAGICAIALKTASDLEFPLARNRVLSCPTGIQLTLYSMGFINCNTIVDCDTPVSYEKGHLRWVTGNNYSKFSAVDTVIVNISKLEISKGKNYKLKTTCAPLNSDSKLSFTSSDSSVASVDGNGFIRALKAGKTTITAKSSNGKKAEVFVSVSDNDIQTKAGAVEFLKIATIYNSDKSVKLTWNKISGASKYRVFRKNAGKWSRIADVSSLEYFDKNVVSDKSYTYTVRALNSKGGYIGSYDRTGVTLKYVSVSKFNSIYNTKDDIVLEWDKVPGVYRYRIFYKTKDTDWTWLKLAKKNKALFKDAAAGEDCSFIIVGVDESGCPVNTYRKNGYSVRRLTKPVLKRRKYDKEGRKIKLSWDKVKGAEKYIVRVLEPNIRYNKYAVKKKLKNNTVQNIVKTVPEKYFKWRSFTTKNNVMIYKGNPFRYYAFSVKAADAGEKSFSVDSDKKSYVFPWEKKIPTALKKPSVNISDKIVKNKVTKVK